MERLISKDGLFPTTASFLIFWSYITLFVSQGLLVTAVQRNQLYAFNAVIVVLLTEFVKLAICIGIYLSRSHNNNGWSELVSDVKSNQRLLLLYLIPAFLYCLYNNLTFINLQLFDVSTYYCLMQFRIVLTALIYQVLFRRQLSFLQWSSLLILTTGCLIKQYGVYSNSHITSNVNHLTTQEPPIGHSNHSNHNNETYAAMHMDQMSHPNPNAGHPHHQNPKPAIKFLWSTGLIVFQMFCSCFAGVYNEYLLKDSQTAKRADVILQNMFMYIDSIICNLMLYNLWSPATSEARQVMPPDTIGLLTIFKNLLTSPLVLILILNNAFSGLVASFFLKSLNSILKTFASALELFAVTFLAWGLFSDRVDLYTVLALVLVSLATAIYSKNPVSVAPPTDQNSGPKRVESRDGFVLLPVDEEAEAEAEEP